MEDTDPLIKPLREHYFPYSSRTEGRNYDIFDEPNDFDQNIYFKIESEYPEKINLDGNLREVFPEADQVFDQKTELFGNEKLREFSNQLDRGEIPEEIEFFSRGEANIGGIYGRIVEHNLG